MIAALDGFVGAFRVVGRVLRAVPWQVWVLLALAMAWWWDRSAQFTAGVAAENARWEAVQAAAAADAEAATEQRDATAERVNTATDWAARDAVAETRTQTAVAVEKVRHAIHTIEVPVAVPVALPAGVRDEGRAAVTRARAAADPLRARRDP